nr:BspA family leucine-rich repeat surface protein [Candidatus Vampirococcus lugosii]
MFAKAESFNQNIGTKEVTVGGETYTAWDVSGIENMNFMFNGASSFNNGCDELDFSCNLNNWDVSNITTIYKIFS